VDEDDFWARLEYRICAEFREFGDRELRMNRCDGLYEDDGAPTDIEISTVRPDRCW